MRPADRKVNQKTVGSVSTIREVEREISTMDYYRLRRALLRALSVAFLAYSCIPSLAFANNNAGLRTMQLHISNHMKLPLDLYVLIWGVINRDNGFGFH